MVRAPCRMCHAARLRRSRLRVPARRRQSRLQVRGARSKSRSLVPTVYIETYGCQMNVADTELILGHLAAHGWAQVERPEAADVILLNTCAIREHAETRVLGRLGDL